MKTYGVDGRKVKQRPIVQKRSLKGQLHETVNNPSARQANTISRIKNSCLIWNKSSCDFPTAFGCLEKAT